MLAPLACARSLPPPGGDEDREPPRIIETTPEHLSSVPGFKGPVVFRFAERISEQGIRNDIVLVSPRVGGTKVSRDSRELRVEIEGGWQPNTVYRVILLPGVRDLFGNELRSPSELAFATGEALPAGVIAGLVSDRITGRPANGAMVEATLRGDSTAHLAAADSASFFAIRYLRPGFYDVVAFIDQNRNRRRDPNEAFARAATQPLNRDGDTIVIENMAVVPADTTAPRLAGAEARDTLQVRLRTDDYLEPSADLSLIQVSLLALPDSTEVPGPHTVMTVDSFQVRAQRRDSIAAAARDTAQTDSLRPPSQRPPAAQRAQRPVEGVPPPTLPVPYQEMVLVPAAPLTPGARYLVTVNGLANISGRTGGGGTQMFEVPERRPPPRDTTGARIDTTSVRRDTIDTKHGRSAPRDPVH